MTETINILCSMLTDVKSNYTNNILKLDVSNRHFKIKMEISDTNIQFVPANKNIENVHLCGVLKNKGFNNINNILEIGEFFNNELQSITNYCSCCYTKMDFQSDTYITCGKEECNYRFEELLVGDPVKTMLKSDPDMFNFLVQSAFDAATCSRKFDIFEPFPEFFLKNKSSQKSKDLTKKLVSWRVAGKLAKIEGTNYDDFKDFDTIEKIINNLNLKKFMEEVDICSDDKEVLKIFGEPTYRLIRFIIMSFKIQLAPDTTLFQKEIKGVNVYKLFYPADKEDTFKKSSKDYNSYLFHGSKWQNWYSILRNGLKNCSRTKLMTTGAAYGNGIYLSDSSNLSIGYGTMSGKSVIGIFEVVGDKSLYHKGGNVFVIDDEKRLIQRYLIIMTYGAKNQVMAEMDTIIGKHIHNENTKLQTLTLSKGVKKLVREYKLIAKQDPKKLGFRVEVDNKDIYRWDIFVFGINTDEPLYQDMQKFNIKEIHLEVKFPPNYPFSPPFIRIISPRFKYLTGHVTQAGSLCMEILTDKGWSAACSIESLIVTIKSEIIEGGGRIDPVNHNLQYSEKEARDSFIRVARGHGWL